MARSWSFDSIGLVKPVQLWNLPNWRHVVFMKRNRWKGTSLQLSLQFSDFRVKARHLGHRFEEKVFMYQVLAILSYFWLILPIVRHCTAYGCSNQSNKVGWENIWTCSSLEKYAFGGMLPHTICLSSLLSLLIMTQTPHFHALLHGNRWTAGSTVLTCAANGKWRERRARGLTLSNPDPIQETKL